MWPVAAMCQVERIRSAVQRGSPMASTLGLRISVSAFCLHLATQKWSVLAQSGPMHRWSSGRSVKV